MRCDVRGGRPPLRTGPSGTTALVYSCCMLLLQRSTVLRCYTRVRCSGSDFGWGYRVRMHVSSQTKDQLGLGQIGLLRIGFTL